MQLQPAMPGSPSSPARQGLSSAAQSSMCPRAAEIVGSLETQRREAQRLRELFEAQTNALLAKLDAPPAGDPLDPVSERAAATASIAKATTEHMVQFVDLAMQKLQTQDDWWRAELEKAGAQSGGLTDYVTQMAGESEELLKARRVLHQQAAILEHAPDSLLPCARERRRRLGSRGAGWVEQMVLGWALRIRLLVPPGNKVLDIGAQTVA